MASLAPPLPQLPPLSPSLPRVTNSSPLDWSKAITGASTVSKEFSVQFIQPVDGNVSFSSEELIDGAKKWNYSLVGYLLGKRPYYEALLAALKKIWKLKGTFKMISLSDGFFLIKFTNAEDYELAFSGGPWFIFGKPFILKQWFPGFIPVREEFSTFPIWVKILNLPLVCWNPLGISKIASKIGIPLMVDNLTADCSRLTFARVCVEIKSDAKLPDSINISLNGTEQTLQIAYDWKPTPCPGCGSLLHPHSQCPISPSSSDLPSVSSRGRSRSRNPNTRKQASTQPIPPKAFKPPPPSTLPPLLSSPPSSPSPPTNFSPSPPSPPLPNETHCPNLDLAASMDTLDALNLNMEPPGPCCSSLLIKNKFQALTNGDVPVIDQNPPTDCGDTSSSSSQPGPAKSANRPITRHRKH